MSSKTTKNILTDILTQQVSALKLFERDYASATARKEAAKLAANRKISPVVLKEITAQNTAVSPEVDRELAKLNAPQVITVVTGQQLGFAGGPLLTLYKILTAVKLARIIEQETNVPTVPIYWLQSEDHDYAEIKDAWFFNQQSELVSSSLEFPQSDLGGPVGDLVIKSAPNDELLAKFYIPGQSLGSAYRKLIQHLLGNFGVLVFDAHRPAIKRQFQEFIATIFNRSNSIGRVLKDRSTELEKLGYQEQVKVKEDSPLFFYQKKSKRERLTELPNGNWLGSDYEISKADLLKEIDNDPSRFTTSALIRPIYQDLLLPTVAYVAGPTEYSYWAQLTPLYSFFGIPQPLVVPRARLLILDQKTKRLLEKTALQPKDLERSTENIIKDRLAQTKAHLQFSDIEQNLKTGLGSLEQDLLSVDKNLEKPLRQTLESSLANIGRLKAKFEQALANRETVLASQIEKARNFIYPNGVEQDRILSMLSFYYLLGPKFFEAIFEKVNPFQGIEAEIVDKLGPEANDQDHA